MKLDIRTIAFITSLIFCTQTIAVFLQYRVNKTYHGLGWWFTGAILQALGFLLMLTFNIPSIHLLSIFANPLIFLGQIFLYIGITIYLDKKEIRWIIIALFSIYCIFYFSFIFILNSLFYRSLTVSFSASIISFLIALTIFNEKNTYLSDSEKFTALVFFGYGCGQILVSLFILILPPLQSYSDFYQVPIRTLSFLLPVTGSILWTFGFIIMVNQRLNEENKKLLFEKELILKEVHHRMKNNMNTIQSLLSLQAGYLHEASSISALKDAQQRVQSMGILYDKLYQTAVFNEISVAQYLPDLIDEIIQNFPNAKFISINKNIDDFILDTKILQPLGIIINELLTNIMKYAFIGRKDGIITVSVTIKNNRVLLMISDNGNGMDESVNFENSTGFGLVLVNALTQQLRGTIRIERETGTRIVLEFDMVQEKKQ